MERKVVGLLIILILFSPHFSRAATSPSLTISIVANNIDRELAGKELEKVFKQRDISYEFVDAGQYATLGLDLIILGGPQTSEGVGPIVKTLLPDYLQDKLITQPDANIAYETVDSKGRNVWIFAGNDRDDTKLASGANYDNDAFNNAEEAVLGGNPNWFEIPTQYKDFITDMLNNNPEWARYVVSNSMCFEDGQLTELEKNYLEKKATDKELLEYYLSELNTKYPDIAKELKKLPEYKEITPEHLEAFEDITSLALTATDSEIKEAFDLMVRGGTGKDLVSYGPNWNSQLRVLEWLGEQTEFEFNDKLPLAGAISNGLWEAMGDEQVDKAVYKDVVDFLNFFRSYTPQVEKYPLDALCYLFWRGNEIMKWNPLKWQPGDMPTSLVYYKDKPLPLTIYEKDAISIETLKGMREYAKKHELDVGNTSENMKRIEDYFWIGNSPTPIWKFVGLPNLIIDENGLDAWRDANFQYRQLISKGKVFGDCGTAMALVDGFAKSLGISTIPTWANRMKSPFDFPSHAFVLYYDPDKEVYKSYHRTFTGMSQFTNPDMIYDWFLYLPPVYFPEYLDNKVEQWQDGGVWITRYYGGYSYAWRDIKSSDLVNMAINGISRSKMKNIIFKISRPRIL